MRLSDFYVSIKGVKTIRLNQIFFDTHFDHIIKYSSTKYEFNIRSRSLYTVKKHVAITSSRDLEKKLKNNKKKFSNVNIVSI